jgi:hypothetical protein
VRALHQHINVTTALAIVGTRAEQQYARFIAHGFTGAWRITDWCCSERRMVTKA